jgi:dihydroorotate dehydrogenase (NAD+) catalytic subunit
MKQDLYFSSPFLNAAGSLGFDPARYLRQEHSLSLGAFVTNPISRRPRKPANHPSVVDYTGGFLLHSGLPNPGIDAGLKRYARRWTDSPVPVIPHLMADRPEEAATMTRRLEDIENVMAVEFGFAPGLSDDILRYALEMSIGELPIIINLPHEQVLSLGPRLLEEGASAISLAPPRGKLFLEGRLSGGRMYGPGLLPRSLEIVHTAARLGMPVIATGGIYSLDDAQAMLQVGAIAVQFDAALWLPLQISSIDAQQETN